MQGFVLFSPGDVRVSEVPEPELGPGQVIVRPRAVGICGSDIHAYHGLQPSMHYPCVLGHEIAGEVVQVPPGIDRVKPGDHVVVDPSISCGQCPPCKRGRPNVCNDLKVLGVHVNGGFADYLAADVGRVYVIDKTIPFWYAAFAEPLSIGAQANARANTSPGDFVAIFGAGPIGIAAAIIAKTRGATTAVIDRIPQRLELARQMGADMVINFETEDPQEAIMRQTGGDGAAISIEAVGNQAALDGALDVVRRGGKVVVLGLAPRDAGARALAILKKELDVLGSRMSNSQFDAVTAMIGESEIDLAPVISHRVPFKDIAEAFALVESGDPTVSKVVITF
ncbi:MAG: alcohol dehydrogenase catalytic domain-containing protein [Firmicutes bacterium]|jgi:L-gulonate 5-dehydrogenase|nr:alcohol dehydrogenase catalytic domain-containing protein [Bacillota bacterium]